MQKQLRAKFNWIIYKKYLIFFSLEINIKLSATEKVVDNLVVIRRFMKWI